jgi:hypothetical protein
VVSQKMLFHDQFSLMKWDKQFPARVLRSIYFFSNPSAAMHLNLGSGTSSALGLTFCSTGLAVDLEWCVFEDLHGSDHYLANLRILTKCPAACIQLHIIRELLPISLERSSGCSACYLLHAGF